MFYDDNGPIFTDSQIDEFIAEINKEIKWFNKRKYNPEICDFEMIQYMNVPCAFDTETTSMMIDGQKVGFMYIWMFGISGVSIYGRTWETFSSLVKKLSETFNLNYYRRLPCYVHNLPFDFQFMRTYLEWNEVFCINPRSPIYASTVNGFEFRCSYALTGTRLEKVGEDLVKHKCKKLVGDLDYKLTRHKDTPLSEEELGYCINDIRVIMCKIQECIEIEGDVTKIPMTRTGYVRRDVRKAVQADKRSYYRIQDLQLTEEELEMWEDSFQGGFTHANAMYSGITMDDVVSYDFTSSYPAVMIAEKYPMSNGTKVDVDNMTYEEFTENIRTKCCLMQIVMTDVELKDGMGDAPISYSKAICKGEVIKDNGRIRKADTLTMTINEQDFIIYRKFYKFDYVITKMYTYRKDYLPKPFIECILKYYNAKTTLKDVEGKELEYQLGKALLNAIFGMMCMMIERPVFPYDNKTGWGEIYNVERSDALEKYNNSKSRFTWFPWGCYITSYARANLFTGIYECGAEDYIYSDTDSIKILHASEHEDYILAYNRQITEKLEACLDHYHIDKSQIAPLTIKNESKPLGVWDFDGHYVHFKTLRAKCYMVENDKHEIKTTVAGVGKKAGAKYISQFENPFDKFDFGLVIPAKDTGKLTHTYIDEAFEFDCTDYLGNTTTVKAMSGIHMEPAKFELNENYDYSNLLAALHMGYTNDRVEEKMV